MNNRNKWGHASTTEEIAIKLNGLHLDQEDVSEEAAAMGYREVVAENAIKTRNFRRVAALPSERVDKFSEAAIQEREQQNKQREDPVRKIHEQIEARRKSGNLWNV